MIFIERYLFYSVLSLPFALVSGPFLSDLIITSGIVFISSKNKKSCILSFFK